jgi:P27 family predicted phage terminase small subunit
MGLRGKAPRPTEVEKLLGNPGHRAIDKNEPKPPALRETDPPSCLDETAAAEWRRIVPTLLELKLLTTLDRQLLVIYCQAVSDYERYSAVLRDEGDTYETETGTIKARPEVALRNAAYAQIVKCSIQFGFSPAARARMNVSLEPDNRSLLDSILDGTPKGS